MGETNLVAKSSDIYIFGVLEPIMRPARPTLISANDFTDRCSGTTVPQRSIFPSYHQFLHCDIVGTYHILIENHVRL